MVKNTFDPPMRTTVTNGGAYANSPVIPDGYVLVPIEPTDEMIAAAMCSDDVLFDKEDDTMFRVQHGEIWRVMLAAAPALNKGEH